MNYDPFEKHQTGKEEEEELSQLVKRAYKITLGLGVFLFLVFNPLSIFLVLLFYGFWKVTEWLFVKERSGQSP